VVVGVVYDDIKTAEFLLILLECLDLCPLPPSRRDNLKYFTFPSLGTFCSNKGYIISSFR